MKKYKYIGETDGLTTNGKIYNVKSDGTFLDDTNTECCLGNDFQKYFELQETEIKKTKTAMQEFIEYLQGIEKRDNIPSWVITTAKNYLEVEKTQIIEAVHHGLWNNEVVDMAYYSKLYYQETFSDKVE